MYRRAGDQLATAGCSHVAKVAFCVKTLPLRAVARFSRRKPFWLRDYSLRWRAGYLHGGTPTMYAQQQGGPALFSNLRHLYQGCCRPAGGGKSGGPPAAPPSCTPAATSRDFRSRTRALMGWLAWHAWRFWRLEEVRTLVGRGTGQALAPRCTPSLSWGSTTGTQRVGRGLCRRSFVVLGS